MKRRYFNLNSLFSLRGLIDRFKDLFNNLKNKSNLFNYFFRSSSNSESYYKVYKSIKYIYNS